MHDIDRISLEGPYGPYEAENQFGQLETGEFGAYEGEYGGQYGNSYEGEYGDSYEQQYEGEGEGEGDYEFNAGVYSESPFTEAEELALASELLNVTDEAELDQFIGKLIKGASRSLKGLLKTPLGAQLGGIIKGAAKSALPLLGAAAGNFLIPGAGGVMGSKLASAAGSMLGLEVEGLSREDQEYEIARQIVRFGGAAVSNADEVQQTAPPEQAAQQAAVAAAQQYAPGLLRSSGNQTGTDRPRARRCRHRHRRTGQWVRRGNKILILGA